MHQKFAKKHRFLSFQIGKRNGRNWSFFIQREEIKVKITKDKVINKVYKPFSVSWLPFPPTKIQATNHPPTPFIPRLLDGLINLQTK